MTRSRNTLLFLMPVLLAACTPTVQLQAPDKPIEINMNVNIEHHVKVEIDRDVQRAMDKNKDIF
ncbi:MAG TPA: YnbE family lipoprotein [Micavibrio sp.]